MAQKPLLLMPKPTLAERQNLGGGTPKIVIPARTRQGERLSPKFTTLKTTIEERRLAIQATPAGADPEMVVVLEIVGSVDEFQNAVRRVEGMEWLAEFDIEDIAPDVDFFNPKDNTKALKGRLYAIASNQHAIDELISMWSAFQAGRRLPRNFGRWSDVFKHLKDVRYWNVKDRLLDTAAWEDWKYRATLPGANIKFEIELWYRGETAQRGRAEREISTLVANANGQIIGQSCVIPDIGYHGILASLPVTEVRRIVENPNTALVKSDEVMFFRPTGQCVLPPVNGDPISVDDDRRRNAHMPEGDPIIGILDGLPLQNHQLLAGRLRVDDPDNWGATYPAHARVHGTGMASLIVHGDLEQQQPPLARPVYVRPILKPDTNPTPLEVFPDSRLGIDFLHQAIRRLFEPGAAGQPPVAPTVKIINLSIGDSTRPFDRYPSPCARLLDWLAWKYNVLFCISAGNYCTDLELIGVPRTNFGALNQDQLQAKALQYLFSDVRNRRVLSPSEAMNALTVGAAHLDSSTLPQGVNFNDPYSAAGARNNGTWLPSPINGLGLGFKRGIKPDLMFAGGRMLYREKPGNTHTTATLLLTTANGTRSVPPGVRWAAPSPTPGELTASRYGAGTSAATALATRAAGTIYDEVVQNLRVEHGAESLPNSATAVLLKALLMHGANWGTSIDELRHALMTTDNEARFRDIATRFLGYGLVDAARVHACESHRATLVGCGGLTAESAHEYHIPLPAGLSGRRVWRRVILTLAYLSPVNPGHRDYRRAQLWATLDDSVLKVGRQQADWQTAKRGTIQHEIFEGASAIAFGEDDRLKVVVNCKPDAGKLEETVPYALAVTLEVAPEIGVDVYEEIRVKLPERERIVAG